MNVNRKKLGTGKKGKKTREIRKKKLTRVGLYNIIIQCDDVRKYLIQCPGKDILLYKIIRIT